MSKELYIPFVVNTFMHSKIMPKKNRLIIVCIVVIMTNIGFQSCITLLQSFDSTPMVLGIMGCIGPKLGYCLIMATHCCKLGEIMGTYIVWLGCVHVKPSWLAILYLFYSNCCMCQCILFHWASSYHKALVAIHFFLRNQLPSNFSIMLNYAALFTLWQECFGIKISYAFTLYNFQLIFCLPSPNSKILNSMLNDMQLFESKMHCQQMLYVIPTAYVLWDLNLFAFQIYLVRINS